jgi:UDP-N-acetylmuramoyl-L-alanyl-D-glutamate--2,6-diaminopimelate ligase
MMLSNLLDGVTVRKMFHSVYGHMVMTQDLNVHAVQYDSRKIEHEDVFVAIRGTASDGHKYIGEAVNRGARVVVMDDDAAMHDSFFLHTGVVKVVVPDSRAALAQLAARMFGNPSQSLLMAGVTGTNGKTTTTHLVKAILDLTGLKAGLIGTIAVDTGEGIVPATHTTPESLELQGLLARMLQNGCRAAVMEVSSHALHQHRVDGIGFSVAVFTNLTQDHLDYHGSMEEYFRAKRILFERLRPQDTAVINIDDAWADGIRIAAKCRVLTYGFSSGADLQATECSLTMKGTEFTIRYGDKRIPVSSGLIGRFNVSNILAAFGAGCALGLSEATLQDAILKMPTVPGRFEQILSPDGWIAVIDYAHTPDALEKALRAVHDVLGTGQHKGRIITVFGCGGNRDRTKRPLMCAIASRLSDLTVATSDNPRHEDPDAILNDVMAGAAPDAAVVRITDRAAAIAHALGSARRDDVILIAGKGHEEYQVVGDKKLPYSDRETVKAFISGRSR